jgi:formamidopyrimidine-DNA glycosylase
MPELPEVETVRAGLAPALTGARIVAVEQRRPDLRFPFPEQFAARLEGARIEGVNRRAKYLLLPLDRGEALISHLGMTGRFTVIGEAERRDLASFYHAHRIDPAHTHFVLETDRGARIEYNDPRRFGYVDLLGSDDLERHAFFKGLGPEPLGNLFHADHLRSAFAGKKQNVKVTLLDQRVVAGLGNIYVCEALYRAGVSPKRAAGKIAPARLEPLTQAVRAVLAEAIEAGGSTLRDFAASDGALGYFQHRFEAYDREGKPCLKPGCGGTIARIVQGGRSTFYCPKHQR